MNKIAETLAQWFGSVPFILFHILWFGIWTALHFTTGFDDQWSNLTLIVSLEAIFLALFILRAENIQSARTEHEIMRDLKTNSQELKELKRIERQR